MENRHEFQAEVKQLLDLMVHSLYSNKDIFLRELISNASDALDRLRFEQLTNEALRTEKELHIRVEADPKERTLAVIDNGIGMSREDVVKNLGTIARSGTREFVKQLREAKKESVPPELIGQFGVGFYASFMVADEVTVVTRKAGESGGTRWRSTGDGSFTVDDAEREEHGTTVTLKLKPADEENALSDYTSEAVLRGIVKRYSDFVSYPIKMKAWRKKGEASAQILEDLTLNSMKAIWTRPKSEVTEAEYKEFYHHISHDWSDPLRTLPVKMEGTFEANALVFIPSRAPFDLYHPEMKRGIQLYVRRVFIMDECKELMPPWLRFVRGVVDASDLSLNVSREILQKDRQIQAIRKQLVRRVLETIEEMRDKAIDDHRKLWSEFGPVMKEGLVPGDVNEKSKILGVLLAQSTHDPETPTTLSAYVSRMKPGQDAIYYLTGQNATTLRRSPLLEAFEKKGYEVLFFTDPIDELWLDRGLEWSGKPFRSIAKGELDLDDEEEKKARAEALEKKEHEHKDLLGALRKHLQDEVKEVKLSTRLTSSPAVLVGDEDDPSPHMQRILEQLGQSSPKTKRILELNPDHAVIQKLQQVDPKSDRLGDYARLLYGLAILAESGHLADPPAFSALVADLLVKG